MKNNNLMFPTLKSFIEKAQERCFNDFFLRVIFLEIKNKSETIDPYMILPRYRGGDGGGDRKGEHLHQAYLGEVYRYNSCITNYVPQKVYQEAVLLVKHGAKQSFKNYSQIMVWIQEQTGISDGYLSSLGLPEHHF